MKDEFVVKDSGARQEFASGMKRDTTEGKVDYTLVFDGPLFERLAQHLTKGAVKYEKRNWMKAASLDEADRFKQSAVRHFIQWFRGDRDEDHFSAAVFNMNGYEYVLAKLTTPVEVVTFMGEKRTFTYIPEPTISYTPTVDPNRSNP